MPTRILFIDHTGEVGGAEHSMLDLATTLSENGYICSFIIPHEAKLSSLIQKNKIGTIHFVQLHSWRWWVNRTFSDKIKFLLSIPDQIISTFKVFRIIKIVKPDIVHFNINRLIEPLFATRLLGCRTVMHFRDIPSSIGKKFMLSKGGFYRIMNLSDVWIANSQATFSDIVPSCKKSVSLIYNGINIPKLLNRAGLDRPLEEIPILMIATISQRKNLEGFIDLAALMYKGNPTLKFYIAGTGSKAYLQELQDKIDLSEFSDNFFFLGYKEDIFALLNSSSVVVHTTKNESFGRVFVEAMLAGKPVVTFKGGGADEIIVDGVTGFLVEQNNLKHMAEKVSLLLGDEGLRNKMGEAGRARAVENFSLEKHVTEVIKIYDSLLQK